MKKQTVILMPALLLAMSLTGCLSKPSGKSSKDDDSTTTSQTSTTSQQPSTTSQGGTSDASSETSEDASEGTSEQESQGTSEGTSEQPEEFTYYFSLGEGSATGLLFNDAATLLDGQTGEYYADGLSVTAGQRLVFYFGSDPILENIGSDHEDEENKNNYYLENGSFFIHNDAENVGIYFKTWSDGGYSFWVTGYVAGTPVTSAFKVVGLNDSWDYATGVAFEDATDPEEVELGYYVTQEKAEFHINAEESFKVTNGTAWYGGEKLEANENFDVVHSEDESNNNIKAKYDGDVELFLKHFSDESVSIYISFTKDAVDPSSSSEEASQGGSEEASSEQTSEGEYITMTFTVTHEAGYGNRVYLVGDFCDWSITSDYVIPFEWGTGNVWTAAGVQLEANRQYHVKLVTAAYNDPTEIYSWEKEGEGNERVATFTESGTLNLEWGNY